MDFRFQNELGTEAESSQKVITNKSNAEVPQSPLELHATQDLVNSEALHAPAPGHEFCSPTLNWTFFMNGDASFSPYCPHGTCTDEHTVAHEGTDGDGHP